MSAVVESALERAQYSSADCVGSCFGRVQDSFVSGVEPIFAGLKTAVSALVAAKRVLVGLNTVKLVFAGTAVFVLVALEPAVGLKTAVAAAVVVAVAEEPALAGPTRVGLAAAESPRRLAMLKAAAAHPPDFSAPPRID